jgi:hypothetical protein
LNVQGGDFEPGAFEKDRSQTGAVADKQHRLATEFPAFIGLMPVRGKASFGIVIETEFRSNDHRIFEYHYSSVQDTFVTYPCTCPPLPPGRVGLFPAFQEREKATLLSNNRSNSTSGLS